MMLPRRLADAIWLYQQSLWDYQQTYHALKNHNSRKRVERQLEDARDNLVAVCVELARESGGSEAA